MKKIAKVDLENLARYLINPQKMPNLGTLYLNREGKIALQCPI